MENFCRTETSLLSIIYFTSIFSGTLLIRLGLQMKIVCFLVLWMKIYTNTGQYMNMRGEAGIGNNLEWPVQKSYLFLG